MAGKARLQGSSSSHGTYGEELIALGSKVERMLGNTTLSEPFLSIMFHLPQVPHLSQTPDQGRLGKYLKQCRTFHIQTQHMANW